MFNSFTAFNVNALSNFVYMVTSNGWMFLMIFSLFGTIVLRLKEQVDTSVREEQNII